MVATTLPRAGTVGGAVTDSTGIAQPSLRLSQKNGSYPLTETWAPAGTDATEFTGAATAGTFTIGKKK